MIRVIDYPYVFGNMKRTGEIGIIMKFAETAMSQTKPLKN